MKRTASVLIWQLLLLFGSCASGFAVADPFQSGDTVCFVGDSITRRGDYYAQVQLFYATRFPSRTITCFNCGISGDTANDIVGSTYRLHTDILGHQPTVATIMLGMNDIGRRAYDDPSHPNAGKKAASLAKYSTRMQQLIRALKRAGVKVTLITPSIYDETVVLAGSTEPLSAGANEALGQCAEKIKGWAVQYHTGLVDFYGRMKAINDVQQKENPAFTLVGPDRIHPGPVGQFVMAYACLRDQGMPAYVSRISVDAAQGKTNGCVNCAVSALKAATDSVAFSCLENALPFPVADSAKDALKLVPFMKELNQEVLQVSNLVAGTYLLEIDEAAAGQYTAAELTEGVNLAENTNTPQYRQASELLQATESRHELAQTFRHLATFNYRILEPKGIDPGTNRAAALQVVRELMADAQRTHKEVKPEWNLYLDPALLATATTQDRALVDYLEKNNIPKPHRFALTRKAP